MSENQNQEPVVEQTPADISVAVSVESGVDEAPAATNGIEATETVQASESELETTNSMEKDESPEMTDNPAPPQLDYLAQDLFDDIKNVSMEDLLGEDVEEETATSEVEKYTSTFSDIKQHTIISGRVIGMNEKEILIDIGFKSEGVINRDEFGEDTLPAVGDKLDVYLEYIEDSSGRTVLSKEKADFLRRWKELKEVFEEGTIISGHIVRRIKGGMVVDLNGVQAFLPGSQIDIRPVQDFDQYVETDMDLRIVKFNEFRKNIVVSHKAILEESLAEQRDALFSELEVGKIVEGRVKNITDFGVFIDLGGIDGLLHITDISWGRVNHPSEIVALDDTLSVKIIDFDEDKKRVSLGLKQLTPHPWEKVDDKYPEGTRIQGRIVSMTNYGAFVEIEPGVEGLIHVSEMSWTRHVKNPSEVYNLGDEVEAVVLSIDTEERKISLGAKQMQPDPWDEIEDKYMVGTIVKGKIINLTQFGAFVELEEGIDGLIHVSDLSWTKVIRHPKEVIERDQDIEVRVLEVSRESRRIALGLKQVEDDPWPEIVKHFEAGLEVEGKIIRVLDKGIILQLEKEVEGIVPFGKQTKRQRKALASKYKPGDNLKGLVMEVKPDDKKVILLVESLSGSGQSVKDDVQAFLDSQEAPVGEKIEIPTESESEDISEESGEKEAE